MIAGVPAAPGERVLWQGAPCWRSLARRLCHVRGLALYVVAVALGLAALTAFEGGTASEMVLAAAPLLAAGGVVLGFLAALAWLVARTTLYAVTTHRLVIRFGIALPATLAIPHRGVARIGVAVHADRTGDIPIHTKPGFHVPLHRTWPHSRPWRMARPQPMLRSVPDAGRVATLLAHALTEAERSRAA